jgi:hypothetical protein
VKQLGQRVWLGDSEGLPARDDLSSFVRNEGMGIWPFAFARCGLRRASSPRDIHVCGGSMFQVHVHVLQRPVLRLYLGRANVKFRDAFPERASHGPGIVAMTLLSGEGVGKAVARQQ